MITTRTRASSRSRAKRATNEGSSPFDGSKPETSPSWMPMAKTASATVQTMSTHQRRMARAAKGSSHRLYQGMRPGASSRQPPMSRQEDTAGSSQEARTMYRLTATASTTPPLAMIHSGAHRPTSPSSAMSRIEAKEPPSTASEYQWMIRSMAVMSM